MDPGNDAIISIDECDPKPKWSNLFKRRDELGSGAWSQTASSFFASSGAAAIKFALFECWEGVVRMWTFRNLKITSRAGARAKGLHPAEAAPDRAKFVPSSGENSAK